LQHDVENTNTKINSETTVRNLAPVVYMYGQFYGPAFVTSGTGRPM